MTRPVSVVVPALDDTELLDRHLPVLLEELGRRSVGDELVVVDDTGTGELARWVDERFPTAVSVARDENGGFARALSSGVERARHAMIFSMNPDVLVRRGFLDPLLACTEDEEVQAAVPRVLLRGEEGAVESLVELALENGELHLRQPFLGRHDEAGPRREAPERPVPVPFAVGGTALVRREAFLARGGFDPLFEPFYWEDIDLGWGFWRGGGRVLFQPASVVEHHHRGTIGRYAGIELVRAAFEKNRLLFQWKHLAGEERLREHLAALYRRTLDAFVADRREELVWLVLALEQLDEALASRHAAGDEDGETFERVLRESGGETRG